MTDSILVLNAGSSSLKFEVFAITAGSALERMFEGQLSGIATRPRLAAAGADGEPLVEQRFEPGEVPDVEAAQERLTAWMRQRMTSLPLAVGHRVVHGGTRFREPLLVDVAVLTELEKFSPLAPLHQPANLAPIRALLRRRPDLPQIACFDTGFHRGHPELADRFALPEEFYQQGVRRYGFHGLSYEYIAGRLTEIDSGLAAGRVVVAHLGSGCSMCALVNGKSIESTMGFTALDGLPMGTRPGQLDAGVVLWLMRERGMGADAIERLLYHECGLKGLSGISNDMRDLLASDAPSAALAIDFFTYRVGQLAAALAAAMGGIDGFVFTAGIGENSAPIRARVAARLAWLGAELDPAANEAGRMVVSTEASRLRLLVVPTDEELMIARHCLALLGRRTPASGVVA
jgi:acetate kinase